LPSCMLSSSEGTPVSGIIICKSIIRNSVHNNLCVEGRNRITCRKSDVGRARKIQEKEMRLVAGGKIIKAHITTSEGLGEQTRLGAS
jgi:hypothetical protein